MFDGFWYRCEVKHCSVADEWGDHDYTSTEIVWTKFAVIRETPKGVWLTPVPLSYTDPDALHGKDRHFKNLVLGNSNKQLACPTRELALADAIARKERHIAGCQARLYRAQEDFRVLKGESFRLAEPMFEGVA
jgi:hypothetical protein